MDVLPFYFSEDSEETNMGPLLLWAISAWEVVKSCGSKIHVCGAIFIFISYVIITSLHKFRGCGYNIDSVV